MKAQKLKKLKSEETVVTVSVENLGTTKEREEVTQVRVFATEPARITVRKGVTIPVGDFQFARVDVELSLPCYREEVKRAYPLVANWVEDKVKEEITLITKD